MPESAIYKYGNALASEYKIGSARQNGVPAPALNPACAQQFQKR